MDMDRIKSRIRKLLNLAADSTAADGEIANAMDMAARLMAQHQIDQAEVYAGADGSGRREYVSPDMGRAESVLDADAIAPWEDVLAVAVVKLVGSVRVYRAHTTVEVGLMGSVQARRSFMFYGPAEDVKIASDLYDEWWAVIVTLAVGKYGTGLHRGQASKYCFGFAQSLAKKAAENSDRHALAQSEATRAIVPSGSLKDVLARIRDDADSWLKTQNVVLTPGKRQKVRLDKSRDLEALQAGKRDGERAEFHAKRMHKLT